MAISLQNEQIRESYIEEWLYNYPSAIETSLGTVTEWIGRQYKLPSGIADLVGIPQYGSAVLVEVKAVPLSASSIVQVCRYTADVRAIVARHCDYYGAPYEDLFIQAVLVGPSIDRQVRIEADACGVEVILFDAQLSLSLNRIERFDGESSKREAELDRIACEPEWNRFGPVRLPNSDIVIGARSYETDVLPIATDSNEACNE